MARGDYQKRSSYPVNIGRGGASAQRLLVAGVLPDPNAENPSGGTLEPTMPTPSTESLGDKAKAFFGKVKDGAKEHWKPLAAVAVAAPLGYMLLRKSGR